MENDRTFETVKNVLGIGCYENLVKLELSITTHVAVTLSKRLLYGIIARL